MTYQKRPMVFVVLAGLVAMLTWAGPAQAKRMHGTKGPDKISGTAKADVIRARGGNDRVRGRGGRDRLIGGRGADRLSGGRGADRIFGGRGPDRLNAVDGRRDRVVRGGPGKDVCRVDQADRPKVKGCETVRIAGGGAPGGSPGGSPPGGLSCVTPPEAAGLPAGRMAQDEPPAFSEPFYKVILTLGASVDGLNGDELPISIEEVCGVPKALESEAAQLVGGDGIALISSTTKVFDATGQQLTGAAATTAVAGADTVSLSAQLQRPAGWRQDEDGTPVPTFATSRVDVTD